MLELVLEVGDCLQQSQLTVHLAVEYMDRFLLLRNHYTRDIGSKSDLELASCFFDGHSLDVLGLSCLLLASKFDEIDDNIPLLEEFCKAHTLVRDSLDAGILSAKASHSRVAYSRSYPGFGALERCELYLLKVLCWDLNTITPMHFVKLHLYQGVIFSNDTPLKVLDTKSLQTVRRHIDYFALEALKQRFMLTKTFSD